MTAEPGLWDPLRGAGGVAQGAEGLSHCLDRDGRRTARGGSLGARLREVSESRLGVTVPGHLSQVDALRNSQAHVCQNSPDSKPHT